MQTSRSLGSTICACALGLAFLFGSASPAQSAVRVGADILWVPLSADHVETQNKVLNSTHRASSFGASVHANIGFDIFSLGLKLNYFDDGITLENPSSVGQTEFRRSQFDLNLMARVGIPFTKFAVVAEGGASLSTKYGGVGYNAAGGVEYKFFELPLTAFQVGVQGQYVNLPVNFKQTSTSHESGRLLLYIGADFGP